MDPNLVAERPTNQKVAWLRGPAAIQRTHVYGRANRAFTIQLHRQQEEKRGKMCLDDGQRRDKPNTLILCYLSVLPQERLRRFKRLQRRSILREQEEEGELNALGLLSLSSIRAITLLMTPATSSFLSTRCFSPKRPAICKSLQTLQTGQSFSSQFGIFCYQGFDYALIYSENKGLQLATLLQK